MPEELDAAEGPGATDHDAVAQMGVACCASEDELEDVDEDLVRQVGGRGWVLVVALWLAVDGIEGSRRGTSCGLNGVAAKVCRRGGQVFCETPICVTFL